ncbi:MAG: hypothetical protein Q8S29_03660 [Phreatobacter sp.]|nr:hypothetical protein [Phreatobacter sp.]
MSSRAGVLALAFSGFLLAGCQTTAQTSGEGGATVQMAREAMARGDLLSTASSRSAPAQAIAPRIYLIRGLANVFSQGMDDLGVKLRQRGYNATVHEHGAWSVIAAEIVTNQRASGGRHQAVVVGHSLGANAVTDIANEVGRQGATVALSVAFDPTVRQQLVGGTRRYVNLFQSNNGWGSAVGAAPGFRGRMENIDLSLRGNITHLNIDKDAGLHAQVIAWVGQAVGNGRRGARQAVAR